MKATVTIHQGEAYIADEKYPFPDMPKGISKESIGEDDPDLEGYVNSHEWDKYDEAFSLALSHAAKSEDQDKIKKLLPNDEWGRSAFDSKYNPDSIMVVDLPPFERVEQYRRITKGTDEWIDLTFEKIVHPDYEYRTIIRFVKESEPKHPLQDIIENSKDIPADIQKVINEKFMDLIDSAPIPDSGQAKQEYIPHQLCPKCYGTGLLSRPPHIPGDVTRWDQGTTGPFVCNLCNGAKTIPMYALKSHPTIAEGKETDCKCEDSPGWTTVKCCNHCGKSVESFWKVAEPVSEEEVELWKELHVGWFDFDKSIDEIMKDWKLTRRTKQ